LVAFLESTSYEDAIRNAVSLGGDADTLACITGGIAEAYYGVPENISRHCFDLLDGRLGKVVQRFRDRFRLR
jgi:type I restriction enzyme M protein